MKMHTMVVMTECFLVVPPHQCRCRGAYGGGEDQDLGMCRVHSLVCSV